ncbi:MAG: hypothetical protein GEU71_13630 [Actinobacteria bacterium]|jgi:hypothetical protein|nr:hypothetical protein [Actinomycetota bacterium]
MGARLKYAKVIDRQLYFEKGGRVQPGLENQILLPEEPGVAAAFLVLRGWSDDHGTCTESWKLVTPGGTALYTSTPREIHLATNGHIEKLEDEVADLKVEYATDDYEVVFSLDGREVARATVPVRVTD